MTKGFTVNELKMRRQRLFDLVKGGKIPGTRPLSSVELQAMTSSNLEAVKVSGSDGSILPDKATELLFAAVCEGSDITVSRSEDILVLRTGNQVFWSK
jgi:hypothetical protein